MKHRKKSGDDPVAIPIDGTLDLHLFSPKDIKTLVPGYLQACREKGILQVRIIHGKGTGSLRRTVHSILEKLDFVTEYGRADITAGSWGATIVYMRANDEHETDL